MAGVHVASRLACGLVMSLVLVAAARAQEPPAPVPTQASSEQPSSEQASAEQPSREQPVSEQPASESSPGVFDRLGITGAVRAGYWSSTRDLDAENHLGAGMIWMKSTRPLSDRMSFLAEGWVALRGPLGDSDATGELREAFVDTRFGRFDLRVGRQIFAWGRADGVNPTDNLTGEDLTLLAPDDDDRRLGTTAVRASYYLGDVSVSGLWLPEFRGHRFPLPAPPPGMDFVREVREWPGDQWAVRVEQTGRAVDWAVSYFDGRDLFPDLGPDDPADARDAGQTRGVAGVRLSHHRVRVAGADMAANVGRFALRAEAAYVDTEDPTGADPFTKNPFVFVVVGGDRTFREHFNLNVQYLYRFVVDYQPAPLFERASASPLHSAVALQQSVLNSQAKRVQHGMSFRAAHKWLHETLEAECAAAAFFGPRGLNIRPKISYVMTDHWKVLVGAEVYRGESSSVFGLLRPNTAAYLEARWSF
jgi:hypothetical protein